MIQNAMIYLGCATIILGSLLSLIAAIGVLRLPDMLTRTHAAAKAGAVGGGLILLALALVSLDGAVALRAIIGIMFLLLTTPISSHLLGRASHSVEDHHSQIMTLDELRNK